MLGNFIYTKNKNFFLKQLEEGHVSDEAIVFIEDTKLIWNHGTYFDCSVASEIFEEYKNNTKQSIDGKVDKVSGKQLSTEDFTTALKTRLEGVNVYRHTFNDLSSLADSGDGWYSIIDLGDMEAAIVLISAAQSDTQVAVSAGWGGNDRGSLVVLNTTIDVNNDFAHVKAVRIRRHKTSSNDANGYLMLEAKLNRTGYGSNYRNTVVSVFTSANHNPIVINADAPNVLQLNSSTSETLLQEFELLDKTIMAKAINVETITATNLSTVATSGNYNDLSNRPTIPAAVTESTVSGWGFTKNTGTYSKPENGIPKDDLSEEVLNALESSYDLPIASLTLLGGVKLGTGFDILNGSDLVLNVNTREFEFDSNKLLRFGCSVEGTIDLNTLASLGVYNILTAASNIIGFIDNTISSNIQGRLTVFNNGTKVTLILTSSLSDVYFRTGVYVDTTPASYNWSAWKVFQLTLRLGNIGSSNFYSYTTPGKYEGTCNYYTGEISDDGTEVVGLETFILFVLTQDLQISLLKYSLRSDGSINIEVRTGVLESVAKIVWGDWKPLIGNVPEATTEVAGGVKLGKSTDGGWLPLGNIPDQLGSGLGLAIDSSVFYIQNNRCLTLSVGSGLECHGGSIQLKIGTTLPVGHANGVPITMGTFRNNDELCDFTALNDPRMVPTIPVNPDQFKLGVYGLELKNSINTKVTWDSNSNMNDFKTPGVYDIYGERTRQDDNIPILNASPGHSIAGRLTVVASTLQPDQTEICITQFLMLSNRLGGEGTMYVRTYNQNNSPFTNGWSPWQKQMGMVETLINSNDATVGQEIFSEPSANKIGDGLNGMIDNGMYSGIYIDNLSYTGTNIIYYLSAQPTFVETFVLIVINDYAASGQLGLTRHITQLKYAVDAITGQSTVKKRVGTGNDSISWSDWEDINNIAIDDKVTTTSVNPVQSQAIAKAIEEGEKRALRRLFVAAGAEYNDSGADKTKTAPWGEIVTHKAGYYYLNGLGDITEEQMGAIYAANYYILTKNISCLYFQSKIRTNICKKGTGWNSGYETTSARLAFYNSSFEVAVVANPSWPSDSVYCFQAGDVATMFDFCHGLKRIVGVINVELATEVKNMLSRCPELLSVKIKGLKNSINIKDSPNFSGESVLYMIQNAAPVSAITISLHADAYARLADDAEIVAALEDQPLITLVSA